MKKPELARLYRPSPPEFFSHPDIVAELDAEKNIVFYRKDVFETLSPIDKSRVLFLRDKYLVLATTEPSYFSK